MIEKRVTIYSRFYKHETLRKVVDKEGREIKASSTKKTTYSDGGYRIDGYFRFDPEEVPKVTMITNEFFDGYELPERRWTFSTEPRKREAEIRHKQ